MYFCIEKEKLTKAGSIINTGELPVLFYRQFRLQFLESSDAKCVSLIFISVVRASDIHDKVGNDAKWDPSFSDGFP